MLHYVSQTKQHDRALLLVTFGSTYEGPHQTFARLKATFAESFPDRDIYMAFTSKFCIRKWKEKTGEEYFATDKCRCTASLEQDRYPAGRECDLFPLQRAYRAGRSLDLNGTWKPYR